jgi:hypothetical protein
MASTAGDRALTYLGLRPPAPDVLGAPRSRVDRIGTPGPDSSVADLVIGIVFLAVLVVAWLAIAVSDTNVALRILCLVAIPLDLLMVGARVRILVDRRAG